MHLRKKIMKTRLYYLVLLVAISGLVACAQENKKVPEEVQISFEKKYPEENDPDWHQDDNGNFEANFKIDGKHYRADFSPDGYWIETERSIKEKDLSKAILKKLKKDFQELEITEIEEVDHYIKGRFYDIEFKRKGKNKDVEMKEKGTIIN